MTAVTAVGLGYVLFAIVIKYISPSGSINSYSASRDNWCTMRGDGGCKVGKVRAGTTSPMPNHKGF